MIVLPRDANLLFICHSWALFTHHCQELTLQQDFMLSPHFLGTLQKEIVKPLKMKSVT